MDPIPEANQRDFAECYRGRHGWLNHAAYMRMAKVLFALRVMRQTGIALEGKDVFDYGFGAGTFFRYCPTSARLHGVEIDPQNVAEVGAMLRDRGFAHLDLRPIEIASWKEHPLLAREYDFILCSHVLEHLPRPIEFLNRMKQCIRPGGAFLALVPINERRMDPHHVQAVFEAKVRTWARATGLFPHRWFEADPWTYWIQGTLACGTGWRHTLARAVSVALGVPATLLGEEKWWALSETFAKVTRSKPTQAAFVLAKEPAPPPIIPDPRGPAGPEGA